MTDTNSKQLPADETAADLSYWHASKSPLQILIFLLPLIVIYELGLALLLRSESGLITNKAHETLLRFFEAFGVNPAGGLLLGGIALILVLLIWHLLSREPWKFDLATTGIMALESIVLVLPLLVMGRLIQQALSMQGSGGDIPVFAPGGAGGIGIEDLGLFSGLVISVGAGLYEELLFRMMFIAAIHTLLVDVGKASHRLGAGIALFVSSLAFALYHPWRDLPGALATQRLAFYFVAGLYFGAIYLIRGFGIVVAVHAFYDVLTVAIINEQNGG